MTSLECFHVESGDQKEEDLLVEIEFQGRSDNSQEEEIQKNQNLSIVTSKQYKKDTLYDPFTKDLTVSKLMSSKAKHFESSFNKSAPNMTTEMYSQRKKSGSLPLSMNHQIYLKNEQETKIYKQIERYNNKQDVNFDLLDEIAFGTIPLSYGCWKVLTWLRTRREKFSHQSIFIDHIKYKLPGTRGNHSEKYISNQKNIIFQKVQKSFLRSTRCCAGGKIEKKTFNQIINSVGVRNLILKHQIQNKKLFETGKSFDLAKLRPCPLSKKIEILNKSLNQLSNDDDDDSLFMGNFKKFKMPIIKIQVMKVKSKAIHTDSKNVLSSILPHWSLSENFCEFALSALSRPHSITNSDESDDQNLINSFEFTIPYQNNKNSILVRDIIKGSQTRNITKQIERQEQTEMDIWTFDKIMNCDDLIEKEVVQIIKDLTESVNLNLNDDLFTKLTVESVNRELIETETNFYFSDVINPRNNCKIMRELNKPNSNVEMELGTGRDSRQKRIPKRFSDYQIPSEGTNDEYDYLDYDIPNKKKKHSKENDDTSFKHQEFCVRETKMVRKEVYKILHCACLVQKINYLEDVEPWCMFHRVYKCQCRNILLNSKEEAELCSGEKYKSINYTKAFQNEIETTKEKHSRVDRNENLEKNGLMRRERPRIDIENLTDLINGKIGPIYINVYDDYYTRTNPVLKSILVNQLDLIYLNGFAYFVDGKQIDTKHLDFSNHYNQELESPIFILRSKYPIYTINTTEASDMFKKNLFSLQSDIFHEVKKPDILQQIGNLIESILKNIRVKLENIVGQHTNDLIKEQLSRIARSRSQSLSSTNTSPLHFHGKLLTQAPLPNSHLMKEFNSIFSKRMSNLNSIILSNSLGLKPSNEMINKLYIYKWNFLISSFEEELIHIWCVSLYTDLGDEYQFLVISDSEDKPKVENSDSNNVLNLKGIKISQNIPEIAKLILLRIETEMTSNLAVLIFGCKGYLRICGVLNNVENYVDKKIVKPNRMTHPKISAKIHKVYNLWFEAKQNQIKKRQFQKQKYVSYQNNSNFKENMLSSQTQNENSNMNFQLRKNTINKVIKLFPTLQINIHIIFLDNDIP